MDELTGKVAVITGGASGIGFGLAEAFAAEGMKIVLADIESGRARGCGREAAGHRRRRARRRDRRVGRGSDDRSRDQHLHPLRHRAHRVQQRGRRRRRRPAVGDPQSGWDWTFGVNFWGVLNGIRAFVPRLIEQQEGHIINTASVAGLKALPFMSPYTGDEARGRRDLGGAGDRAHHDRIAGEGLGALSRLHPHPHPTNRNATGQLRSATRRGVTGRRHGARPDRGRHGPGRARAARPRRGARRAVLHPQRRRPRRRPRGPRRGGEDRSAASRRTPLPAPSSSAAAFRCRLVPGRRGGSGGERDIS